MDDSEVSTDAEERAQFTLRMRARGVSDIRLLRALERAPRALFMPRRYADIAAKDIALPIGCGQTAPPPSVVAAMIEALALEPGMSVLEIGAGSGYATALLAQMTTDLLSVERCQTLALEAAERMAALGLRNARVIFADALSLDPGRRFDRILVHALIEPPAAALTRLLAPGGALVAAVATDFAGEQRCVKIWLREDGQAVASDVGLARTLTPLAPGVARAL